MKQLIIALIVGCAALQAAENFEVAPSVAAESSELTAQEGASFLEQLRQVLGSKSEEKTQEVRPLVDPSGADSLLDEQGDSDFDLNENGEIEFADESFENQQEELSGEEMSEYFADVSAEDVDGAGL